MSHILPGQNAKADANEKGRQMAPLFCSWCQRLLLAAHKLRIGFHAALGQIHTFVLVFFRDSDAHDGFQDAPDNQAGNEYPDEDGEHADQLTHKGGVCVGQENREDTPDTHHTVYRDGTDRIVNAQLVHGYDGEDHQGTTDGANDDGQQGRRVCRLGGNCNQASQGTVQGHGQVGLAKHQTRHDQGGNQTTGCSCVGVQEHVGNFVGDTDATELQGRTTVEAEPAHPQDEGTKRCQRQVGTGEGADFAFCAVLAFTGTEEENTSQSPCCASHVDDAGTGVVAVAKLIHAEYRVAVPGPGTLHRVDETTHNNGKSKEGPEFHTLSHGTGNDGHGGCNEDNLEEEVRSAAVFAHVAESGFSGGSDDAGNSCVVHFSNGGDAAQEDAAIVHDVVADDQVHGTGDREQGYVLGQDFGGVLGTHQAGFQHGKASGHPHDQSTANQEVKGIQRILEFKNVI